MKEILEPLAREEAGQNLVEYGLVVALVALTATAATHGLGQWLADFYDRLVYLSQFLRYGN